MQAEPRPKKLLDQVRDAVRLKHYSYRTEQTYVQWIRCFTLLHDKHHPQEIGIPEIEAFLAIGAETIDPSDFCNASGN